MNVKSNILLIDHLAKGSDALNKILSDLYPITVLTSPQDSISTLQRHEFSVILANVDLPNGDGVSLLRDIKQHYSGKVVALTTNKTVEKAVRTIQEGACDYLDRTQDQKKLLTLIEKLLEQQEKDREISFLRSELTQMQDGEICIGKSPQIKKVMDMIERIAPLPTTVLLVGESGTGKEIMARYIHRKSHLRNKPFVTVNLPSIPDNLVESVLFGHERGSFTSAHRRHYGKFELADGGTIFLDEIGDLHFDVQSKLLRVIQEGEIERVGGSGPIKVNVRVIAASKADLKQSVKQGKFRDDLYYRLNVVPIILPPLRKRLEDLPEFCELFVKRYAQKFGKETGLIKNDAVKILKSYRWPGNIRELENLVERMVAIMDANQREIGKEDIPLEYYFAQLSEGTPGTMILDDALIQYERNLIIKALKENNWSRKKTAETLGISYGILKYKVRKYNISIPGRVVAKS